MRNVTFLASLLIILLAIEGCAQTPERLVTPVTSQPVDATQDNPYSVKASDSDKEGAVNSEQQAPSKRPQEVKGGSKPREPIGTLGVIGLFFKCFALGFVEAGKIEWDRYIEWKHRADAAQLAIWGVKMNGSAGEDVAHVQGGLAGPSAGHELVNDVACDQTPSQGMAPYEPGMCRDPRSGGQIPRQFLVDNPCYARFGLVGPNAHC